MRRDLAYRGRFVRDLKRLDTQTRSRLLAAMERLAATGEGDVRPLRGEFAGSYRLRVGKWRVFFTLDGGTIVAYQLDNRGEAY